MQLELVSRSMEQDIRGMSFVMMNQEDPKCISRFCFVVVVLGAWGNIPALSAPSSPYQYLVLRTTPIVARYDCCSGAVDMG